MKESFDSRIRTAARLLSGAEYVLIGGGAGLSAAAGLAYSRQAVYRQLRRLYRPVRDVRHVYGRILSV